MKERREVRDFREVLRDEMVMRRQIMDILREAPRTIPAVAEALGRPLREVTLWMMAMWRYGLIEEMGRPDGEGYYSYRTKKED